MSISITAGNNDISIPNISSDIMNKNYCPFVEKHRPNKFDDIVLDPINRNIELSEFTFLWTTRHRQNDDDY